MALIAATHACSVSAVLVAERKTTRSKDSDYVPFELEDYVDNPIALARIRARLTQAELAKRMGVTQAYISKIEA